MHGLQIEQDQLKELNCFIGPRANNHFSPLVGIIKFGEKLFLNN